MGETLVVVLDPDDRHVRVACAVDEGRDVGDDGVALVRLGDDTGLHVDDEQHRARAAGERRHQNVGWYSPKTSCIAPQTSPIERGRAARP